VNRARPGLRLPLPLLLLDVLGTLLVVLGAWFWFGGGEVAALQTLRFPWDGPILVVAGVVLMLPLVIHVLRHASARR
jgi:hypothetical protein